MNARWILVIAIFAVSAIGTVITVARTPTELMTHDVAWYAVHPAERHSVLAWCRSDVRHADAPDCSNAFRSEAAPNVVR
jgi:hypothetical protein